MARIPVQTFLFVAAALLFALCVAETGPRSRYILSPHSRTIVPKAIYRTTGNVQPLNSTGSSQYSNDIYRLKGPRASITYDFGQVVAGIPTLRIRHAVCDGGVCETSKLPSLTCKRACQGLGLAYTEQEQFIGLGSDQSTIFSAKDGTVYLPLSRGTQTVPAKWGRGGFRYLTLSLDRDTSANTNVDLQFVKLQYTPAPNIASDRLRSYTGHFYSSDDLLNRIWYAGAYTLQLCTVGAHTSVNHIYVALNGGWANAAKAKGLSASEVFLADGAKRDRNPWAGDVSIALGSTMMAQNYQSLRSIRNTIQECIMLQSKAKSTSSKKYGFFPYAGSPLGDLLVLFGSSMGIPAFGSDTYHLWTIHSYAEYILATGDLQWARIYWPNIVKGLVGTYKYIGTDGLYNGQGGLDWGRKGAGGKNTALNALYYRVLLLTADMAKSMPNDPDAAPQKWRTVAARLKQSANRLLFDTKVGLYRDNTTAAGHRVHPQDGNAFAINFGLTRSKAQAAGIARRLASRWTKFGAPAPELPGSISPFITSHEVNAQFEAHHGDASLPLELIRTQWGYMLRAFSNATLIEGYGAQGDLFYGFYGNATSFVSNAHAWSTGPTYSLIRYVVGIRATAVSVDAADGEWAFQPHVVGSGLKHAEGGFKTAKGEFAASWRVSAGGFEAAVSAPAGLKGTLYAPTLGHSQTELRLKIDGKTVQKPNVEDSYIRVAGVDGGHHTISVQVVG